MRSLLLLLACLLLAGTAFAADIVTMPTANQLKQGEVDVAAYYLGLDMPAGAPQHVWYQTLYLGVTDRFELDVHRADVDVAGTSTVLVGSYLVNRETATLPDVVVGVRNFLEEDGIDPSYFVSTAKTFFLRDAGAPPLVRAHLSYGTEDLTLLGAERHDGFFGGLQALVTPNWGAIALYDGEDVITGISYMPTGTDLTIKGGTYGDHWWAGIAWDKDLF